jgi:alpha-ketoglutarate-dependent 2,4-dichlorophenoxyacetate dioxygenase
MTVTVHPITPDFAAEISGVDLREPLDKTAVIAINDAINKAGVLVFHDQFITDEQQQAFSRNFGDLETTVKAYRKDFVPRLDVHMADISNLDEQNRVLRKTTAAG